MDSLRVDLYMDLFSIGVDQGFRFFSSNLDQHLEEIDVVGLIVVIIFWIYP